MFQMVLSTHRNTAVLILLFCLFAIPRSAAAQAGNADEGQKLYVQNCASCHGPDGSANTSIGKAVGAKDLRSPVTQKLTDAEISTQISEGKGNMPPFSSSLSKEKVNNLVAYVRELGKKQTAAKKP